MYAEDYIAIYRESGDVMAVNYVLGRTEQYRLKQRTAVINGLDRIFSEMYYIDLRDNTVQKVTSQDLIRHERGENKDARKTLRMLADAEAVGAFRPIMRNFWDYDTMDQRLGTKVIISQEYVNVDGQWIRCSIRPAERDEKGIRFLRSARVEHPDVIVDQTKLREILLNILSNALKYTPSGGTVFHIS